MAKKILYVATSEASYWRVLSFASVLKNKFPESKIVVSKSSWYPQRIIEVFLRSIPEIIKQKEYDALFLGCVSQVLFPFYAVFWKKPIINDYLTSMHETIVLDRKIFAKDHLLSNLIKQIDLLSLRKSALVILDTTQRQNQTKQQLGNDSFTSYPKLSSVILGANTGRFQHQLFPRISNQLVITYHGKFIPLHGVDNLIRAIYELKRQAPSIKVNLIGNGQTHQHCKRLVKRLGLKNIIFHGFLTDKKMIEIYRDTHIGVGVFGTSSKVGNTIPNKIYELMALNKVIITKKTPAINEVIEDKKSGFLVDGSGAQAIADSLIEILNVKSELSQIAARSHSYYIKNLSFTEVSRQLEKELKEL